MSPREPSLAPLSPLAQQLLSDITRLTENNLSTVVLGAGADEAIVQIVLLTKRVGVMSAAHLAVICSSDTASLSDSTCLSSFPGGVLGANLDACFRTGCLKAGISLVDVFATVSPNRSPEMRTAFEYPTEPPYPAGTVTYNPNPSTRWLIDSTRPGTLVVSAEFDTEVSVAFEDERIDCSHVGRLHGIKTEIDFSLEMTLTFPEISALGPIVVHLERGTAATERGSILQMDKPLATISERGIDWLSL
jgi:hypothetical protein